MNPEITYMHAEPGDTVAYPTSGSGADAASESGAAARSGFAFARSNGDAIRERVAQKADEIGDDEMSLLEAISNLLTKKGEVPQDIASPLCPLYIHKLRMIGASFNVKKDAVLDYAVATARDVFWTVNDVNQTYIDAYFRELTGVYHRASQGGAGNGCSSAEAQEIGLRVFNKTMAEAKNLQISKCGSGSSTNRGMLLKISNNDYEELEEDVNWHPFYEQEMNEDA